MSNFIILPKLICDPSILRIGLFYSTAAIIIYSWAVLPATNSNKKHNHRLKCKSHHPTTIILSTNIHQHPLISIHQSHLNRLTQQIMQHFPQLQSKSLKRMHSL